MKKRLLLILVTVIAITVSAAAYYRAARSADDPNVLTTVAARGDVVETVAATGTLEAVTTVQVGTQVSGSIKAIYADFNAEVRKGQVIAQIEPSLFQAQVDQAQATVVRLQADVERARVQVDDAQAKLKRAQELWKQQLIPATDLEAAQTTARDDAAAVKSAEAQVTQARAALNQSAVSLQNAVIRAPIDGVVISRNVDVGQTVAASMSAPTLFVIAQDLTRMKVSASVDEADIGRIRANEPVSFKVDAYPDETFRGQVSQVRLQPVTEQNVVSYTTVIDVPNPDLKLKPGMTASVTIEVARASNVIRIPTSALRFTPTTELFAALQQELPQSGAPGAAPATARPSGGVAAGTKETTRERGRVWVLADGQLTSVPVRLSVNDGATTAVVGGGLHEGDAVVTGMAASAAPKAAANTSSPFLPRFGGNRGGASGVQRPASGGQR